MENPYALEFPVWYLNDGAMWKAHFDVLFKERIDLLDLTRPCTYVCLN